MHIVNGFGDPEIHFSFLSPERLWNLSVPVGERNLFHFFIDIPRDQNTRRPSYSCGPLERIIFFCGCHHFFWVVIVSRVVIVTSPYKLNEIDEFQCSIVRYSRAAAKPFLELQPSDVPFQR